MRKSIALALIVALLTSCASADYTIRLSNDTTAKLIPYPVVTSPPPPHREADPANSVFAGHSKLLDPTGFNPLFYFDGRKVSLTWQFALDENPPTILVRTTQHQVPPGQEGNDPALKPTLVSEELFEPTKKDLNFILSFGTGVLIVLEES